MTDVAVRKVPQSRRYEAVVEGTVAGFADYRDGGGPVVLPHTVVDPAFEGRGVGSALARHALDDIRAQGRTVVPTCSFVRAWIDRHPDYASMVADPS